MRDLDSGLETPSASFAKILLHCYQISGLQSIYKVQYLENPSRLELAKLLCFIAP